MRDDSGAKKLRAGPPSLLLRPLSEQTPTILKVVPFFHGGSGSALDSAGKTAENTYFPEDNTMVGSPADSSCAISCPSISTSRHRRPAAGRR
jgi:hypothetical protein